VIVLPFEPAADTMDAFGDAAASWIARGLALDGFDVVPWSSVVAARTPGHAADSLATALGARIVVAGTYLRRGDSLSLHAFVTGPDSAPAGPVESLQHPLADALAMAERLRVDIGVTVAARVGTSRPAETLRMPPRFEVYRDYLRGQRSYLVDQDYGAAAEILERAAVDSAFAAPLVWAALAYHALGDPARVDSLAGLALGRDVGLTTVERHGAEYLVARARGDLEAAQAAAGRAATLAPFSVWAFHEAVAALGRNRADEAAALLVRVDPETGPLRHWSPYWTVLAETHHVRGEHDRELEVARRARTLFPTRIDMVGLEVRALAGLGRAADVHLRLDRSLALEGSSPDATAPVTLMLTAGRELRAHGSADGAARAFERALEWLGRRPEEERLSLGGIEFAGRVLYLAGRYDDAMSVYRSLLPTRLLVGFADVQARGDTMRFASSRPPAARDPFTLTLLSYRGAAAARAGEQAEQVTVNRVDRLLANLDDPYFRRQIVHARARVAAAGGERDRAIQLLREAIAVGLFPADLHADPDFDSLLDSRAYRTLLSRRN
jgi:tetratricopeptide (TPR) repeat protein/TolB-like protein